MSVRADCADAWPPVYVTGIQTMIRSTIGSAHDPIDDRFSKRGGGSPFNHLCLRQAMNHSIDREGIIAARMGAGSNLSNFICAPVQFGCDDSEATVCDCDPERARELLAEAGYENGFSFDFYAYRERPNAEAIIDDLNVVGIRASLNYIRISALADLRVGGRLPALGQTSGFYLLADISAITGHFFTMRDVDHARDDEVAELVNLAENTMDSEARLDAYRTAHGLISERAYAIPLFTYALTYAYSESLDFIPTSDATPRFYSSRWKDGDPDPGCPIHPPGRMAQPLDFRRRSVTP